MSYYHCEHCPRVSESPGQTNNVKRHIFRDQHDFVDHLKTYHLLVKATQGGKVYICCYGPTGSCVGQSSKAASQSNGINPSLCMFANQREYERHLVSEHLRYTTAPTNALTSQEGKCMSNSFEVSSVRWSVLQSVVNLPAILNDPSYRQVDIFSRLWGDQFERTEVQPSPRLPVIDEGQFKQYLSKLGVRGVWSTQSSPKPNVLLQAVRSSTPSGNLLTKRHTIAENGADSASLDTIPRMFFDSAFSLQTGRTFSQVVPLHTRNHVGVPVLCANPFAADASQPVVRSSEQQEKEFRAQHDRLTNYLDIVEVHLAEQVSKKSSIFFEAVCCHDVVREQLSQTLTQVRLVRQRLHQVDSSYTTAAMRLHRQVRRLANCRILLQKLNVIAGLQGAQPTIQSLLRSNDFCAALDLVAHTQDLLAQTQILLVQPKKRPDPTPSHTIGGPTQFTCLRYLNAQLAEISRFVRRMIEAEFEAALRQFLEPRSMSSDAYRGPDLVPCLLGLLHIRRHDFVSAFRSELIRQVKQIQSVPLMDKGGKNGEVENGSLRSRDWIQLVADRCGEFRGLLTRSEEAVKIFVSTMSQFVSTDAAVEESATEETAIPMSVVLSSDELGRLTGQLRLTMQNLSEKAQKHLVDLVSMGPSHGTGDQRESSVGSGMTTAATTFADCNGNLSPLEQLNTDSFFRLVSVLEEFQTFLLHLQPVETTASVDSKGSGTPNSIQSTPAKASMDKTPTLVASDTTSPSTATATAAEAACQVISHSLLARLLIQLTRSSITKFHAERATKLDMILNQERWQAVPVPSRVQALITRSFEAHTVTALKTSSDKPNWLSIISNRTFGDGGPSSLSSGSPSPSVDNTVSNTLALGSDRFVIVGTVLLLLPILMDYVQLAGPLPCKPWSVGEVTNRLAELLNSFNSRTCQLVLGAEARRSADLPTISARNLALASRSLQLIVKSLPILQSHLDKLTPSPQTGDSPAPQPVPIYANQRLPMDRRQQQNTLQHVAVLFQEHISQINDKLFNLLSDRIQDRLSLWHVRPPSPSVELRAICSALTRMAEMIGDVLPEDLIVPLLLRAHNEFKTQLRHRLSGLAVIADGGPKQSLVDSELTYYMNRIRQLTPRLQSLEENFADVWPDS